jgi:hypothetical protein
MNKFLLSLTALLVFAATHAQTEKGDWLVGGNFQLNTAKNNTLIGLTPMAGKFIIGNLAVGGDFSLTYTKTGSDKVTQFGVGPFARYYFLSTTFRPLVQANISFLSSNSSGSGYSSTNTGSEYFLGGGGAFFINENVSLEGLLGYDHTKYGGYDGGGGLKFTIGFQVYLHQREMARLKGQ